MYKGGYTLGFRTVFLTATPLCIRLNQWIIRHVITFASRHPPPPPPAPPPSPTVSSSSSLFVKCYHLFCGVQYIGTLETNKTQIR